MKKEELKHTRQYKTMMNNPKAVLSVPLSWCVRFDLTATELLILRHIQYLTALEDGNGVFTGTIKGLCAIVNCTLPTARKACDHLHDMGFIRKDLRPRTLHNEKEVDWVCYRACVPFSTTANDRGIESLLKTELTRRAARNYVKPYSK